MEGSGAKRQRSSNYSLQEKSLLMSLVNKYKHIVENKKTDAVTNAEKEKAWEKICNEFNAVSPNNVYRDKNSLKKMCINMKASVRKEVADDKINTVKTGGGPSQHTNNPLRELTLEAMNTKTVFGLQHPFDSDNIAGVDREAENNVEEGETILIEYETTAEVNDDMWNKWKPANLKHPVSTPLRANDQSTHTPSSSSSRRRPVASVAHSSNIANIYTDLAEQRIEATKLEQAMLKNKLKWEEESRTFEREKQKLEIQILEVELQIKIAQLKKLNPNCAETDDLRGCNF